MNNMQKMLLILSMITGCLVVLWTQFGKKVEMLDENGRISLYQIIETNDIDAVRNCIESGSNVNHHDKNGITPLQFTTQLKKHSNTGDITQLLINAGADLTVKNEAGYSLLQMAVEKRNDFIVAVLVHAGLDVNVQDPINGCTPLHTAIIQAGVAAIKDYQGLVTCPCCVEKMFTKSVAIAQALLNAGADRTIKNNHHHTVQDIIEILFVKVDGGTYNSENQSNLYYDVQNLVDLPQDFDAKIVSKFQVLENLFAA